MRGLRYFVFARPMPVDACQSPPAALQSAWLVIFDSELPLEEPGGLADGVEEADEEGIPPPREDVSNIRAPKRQLNDLWPVD